MKRLKTSTAKSKIERKDDSELSKNHSKSVKFRLRVQQEKEAEELIKEYKVKDDTERAD